MEFGVGHKESFIKSWAYSSSMQAAIQTPAVIVQPVSVPSRRPDVALGCVGTVATWQTANLILGWPSTRSVTVAIDHVGGGNESPYHTAGVHGLAGSFRTIEKAKVVVWPLLKICAGIVIGTTDVSAAGSSKSLAGFGLYQGG